MCNAETKPSYKHLITSFIIALFVLSATSAINAQNSKDAEWLIDALELKEGSVVAEIGAGNGRLTLAIARFVGSSGKVYSSELGADSVEFLENVVEEADLSNVTVVEGHPERTNLPEACCDAIFMRRVYHHFNNPSPMNKSIWQSLKPGGRIAVIDFAPRSGESAEPSNRTVGSGHGVSAETVVKELRQAGFSLINSEQQSGRNIYVVMQKEQM